MKAIRIRRSAPQGTPYTSANPAPPAAIELKDDIATPHATQPGQLVVQIKATTVIRDSLTWEELYSDPPAHMGNDFSGVVVETYSPGQDMKVGDEVYGMTSAHRGGTWAEYAIATSDEAYPKPNHLSWEEAAALPLSALTADQALFTHAKLSTTAPGPKRVLITGASGGVGMLLVQFAAIAEYQTIAASSSNARNETFLRSLGASEIVEYEMFPSLDLVDVVIDTVGGSVLAGCWRVIKADGVIVSVDSNSYHFGDEHRKQGLAKGKESVRAVFFVVEPSGQSIERISKLVSEHGIKGQVARTFTLSQAREAYEMASSRGVGRGKVVLTV
jgi:NADPH2:quinone reductase